MMPEYTVLAVVSVVTMVCAELFWYKTGIFGSAQYWLSMVIVNFFQILVDGWLTKANGTIVNYAPGQISGLRVGWHTPIEDFGFGFAMITLVLVMWIRFRDTENSRSTSVDAQKVH